MGKFALLNVLIVVLAVYASARYTYQNKDGDIEEEIDALAKALDDPDKRDAFDDYCDSVCDGPCDCDDPDCIPDECDLKREVDEAVDGNGDEPGTEGLQKKLFIPRFRIPRIRVPRIPTPRIPRIRVPRFPRIRIPRFPRIRIPRF